LAHPVIPSFYSFSGYAAVVDLSLNSLLSVPLSAQPDAAAASPASQSQSRLLSNSAVETMLNVTASDRYKGASNAHDAITGKLENCIYYYLVLKFNR